MDIRSSIYETAAHETGHIAVARMYGGKVEKVRINKYGSSEVCFNWDANPNEEEYCLPLKLAGYVGWAVYRNKPVSAKVFMAMRENTWDRMDLEGFYDGEDKLAEIVASGEMDKVLKEVYAYIASDKKRFLHVVRAMVRNTRMDGNDVEEAYNQPL